MPKDIVQNDNIKTTYLKLYQKLDRMYSENGINSNPGSGAATPVHGLSPNASLIKIDNA